MTAEAGSNSKKGVFRQTLTMAIYLVDGDNARPVEETTFQAEGILERRDLQGMFRHSIEILVPDALVLAEEFCDWEDSRRRVDLLCLDRSARLVVVELKRTEDGGAHSVWSNADPVVAMG